jgi:flagellar hook-length control protein FliK
MPAKPAAPVATAAPQPVVTTVAAPSAQAPIATPAAAVQVADASTTANTNVDDSTADDAESASLAALVKHPATPRTAEPRATATPQADAVPLLEPSLNADAPVDAPAPRSGAGTLTAATGLAAQVKGQELQNTPLPTGTAQNAAITEKTPVEIAVAAAAASNETDPSVEPDAPNTPSTARTSDGHAPQQTHDSSVRGTSFADALSAARGSRTNANPLVAQVVVQVTKAVSEGHDRITIQLSPADLGRIDVRLDIGADGKIQAVFAADKPQTVEMLQRDARELERALQDAGLRADSGSLSFNLRGEQQQRDGDASSFAGGRPASGDVDAQAEVPAAAAQIYSTTTGGNGRLDIHV